MGKTFIVTVHAQDDYCGADFAILEISPNHARLMLQRIDVAAAQKDQDNALYALSFWDYTPTFIAYSALPEELAERVEEEELVSLDQPLAVADDHIATVECRQVVVRPDEAYWTGYIKHTGIRVETAIFPRAVLEEIAQPVAGPKPAAP